MLYERIIKEQQEIQKQLHNLQVQIDSLPDGKFICSRSGNNYKWYQSDGFQKTYIPKKNRKLAEQLAKKKYLTLKLKELKKDLTAIEFYLRHCSSNLEKSDLILLNNPEYHELLAPYFKPKSQELSEWMYSDYERNNKYPEHLIHQTASGNLVRSKSEVLIDLCLYRNKIPFRYECALQLGATILFPDFTIRHPETGDTYYWEHFGLMDNKEYIKSSCTKLELYALHGILPTIQLITTYETSKCPLSIEAIEQTISQYFL